ncbi:MAG: flippase-like domain-containing protein [Deltaproteobacteria bacterium]|jgi:uncharacterized membrane protein YbhN (UPF0104 family)|nr:flippase-like domain-containing protein [Deltaproteobacteria bacterium]
MPARNPETEKDPNADGGEKKGKGRRIALGLLLTLVFLLAILWYVRDRAGEFRELAGRIPGISSLWPAFLGVFLVYLANGETVRLSLRFRGTRLPFLENQALNFAASALNWFVPFKGAAGLKALYLNKRHGLRVSDFLAQTAMVGVLTLSLSSFFALLGLAGLAAGGKTPGPAGTPLVLYFGATLALGAFLIFKGKLPFPLPGRLAPLAASWETFRKNPWLMAKTALADSSYFLAWTLTNRFCLEATGIEVNLWGALFYAGGQVHTLLMNLTPAGLGLMEAYAVFAGSILGFTPAGALLAQGIFRLSAVAVLSATGLLGYLYLTFAKAKGKGVPGA